MDDHKKHFKFCRKKIMKERNEKNNTEETDVEKFKDFNRHSFIDYGGDDTAHHSKGRISSENRIKYHRFIDGD